MELAGFGETFIDTDSGFKFKILTKDSENKTGTVSLERNGYSKRTSLDIPDSVEKDGLTYTVTEIAGYAFYECSSLTGDLVIPEGVTSIGSAAFYKCSGLTGDLTIPKGVTSIGESAFYGCYRLTKVFIFSNNLEIGSRSFKFLASDSVIYVMNDDVKAKLTAGVNYDSNGTTVQLIPNVSDFISFNTDTTKYTGSEFDCVATIDDTKFTPVGTPKWTIHYAAKTGKLGVSNRPCGVGTYAVTVTYMDDANMGSKTMTFTINKASAPTIEWPTATGITYGGALSSATLDGGSTEYGSFSWEEPAMIPNVGNRSYNMVFTPSKATIANYEAIATLSKIVEITITKAPAPTIEWPTATSIAYGSPLSSSKLVGGSTQYGSFAWKNPATIPTAGNNAYSITFTPNADTIANYEPITQTTKLVDLVVTNSNNEQNNNGNNSAKNGWIKENSKEYYYINNVLQKNAWIDQIYRTDASGAKIKGAFVKVGKETFYMDSNGKLTTGTKWITVSKKKYRIVKNVVQMNKVVSVGKKSYVLNSKGVMQTKKKFYTIGKKTYYVSKTNGTIAKNKWITVKKKTYRADKKGVIIKNKKVKIGGKTYNFNKKGVCSNK